MKKLVVFLGLLLVVFLTACGDGETNSNDEGAANGGSDEETSIKVGATSVPHAEILEEAKPILAEKGIELNIQEFQDYVTPNDALAEGEIDANYFQHIPYLEQTIADTGYDFDHFKGIHIEPMGIYSKDFTSLDDVPKGSEVILSNSVADHARVLALFAEAGLIELDDSVEASEYTFDDITANPKELEFLPDYDAAFLPELYETEDDVLVVINTNYAIEAGLNPLEDALFIEGEESRYVNVVAVRSEDKDHEALKTLVDVLHSDEIQTFIKEKYDGAVVPVGGNE
ncbi:Membrane lipoprotein TpN32 [Lentibacillus sp. JNUCC-1]|uniref:MetQ/NlpA family ABC transporter substrate-binding protein n=1 Tax=Lentibacillus sp. JNUCC-1 TaxID=2654513 RepID=UPI0012E70326|nr:MetQ/NlpA family ABC transporter substrate-binding protein [Lentibacillus sp. JNUCC-1]MUV39162.1 Membrane lipoprotein TpN32 [Lentibacillus sp. JNUCC-1]